MLLIADLYFFFFFSSRRRHTRLQGDWSSDVCSSDLGRRVAGAGEDAKPLAEVGVGAEQPGERGSPDEHAGTPANLVTLVPGHIPVEADPRRPLRMPRRDSVGAPPEIGRAHV